MRYVMPACPTSRGEWWANECDRFMKQGSIKLEGGEKVLVAEYEEKEEEGEGDFS